MKSVYKYPIPHHGGVEMPEGAKILSVHAQNGSVCLWALVDTSSPRVPRRFRMFGTGHPMNNDLAERLSFVGTALLDAGFVVVHVFEEMPNPDPCAF